MFQKALSSVKSFYFLFVILLTLFVAACFVFDGIGNGGDSVLHYLIAKYAPIHPYLYFFHWGKPFFTLIASVFAQFGFEGIKLFNTLCTFTAIYFSYKLAQYYSIKNAALLVLLVVLWPLTIGVNFTGLTEPLFACMLIASVYMIAIKKENQGSFLISFLPFVRSEGLIILLVLSIYFIINRNKVALALLAAGHILMSIAGVWVYNDILWVFTKIPYAYLNPIYGKGTWDHFIIQLNFMIGPIQYALLIIAVFSLCCQYQLSVIKQVFLTPKLFLIYLLFAAFFMAHALFWALGIFGSMGLTRVFYGIMPLMALIVLEGYNTVYIFIENHYKQGLKYIPIAIVTAMVVFPFLNNPASYSLKRDLLMSQEEQLLKDSVCSYIKTNQSTPLLVASDYRIPYFLNKDPFDSACYQSGRCFTMLKAQKIPFNYIWDNWFSEIEDQIRLERLQVDSGFVCQKTYSIKQGNSEHTFKIFNPIAQ